MKEPKQQKQVQRARARSSFLFEELEPRLLLSADLPVDISNDFSLQQESLTQSSLSELEVPDTLALHASAPGNPVSELRQEMVFVDSNTPDYQLLLDDLLSKQDETRRFEVILIDNKSDGIRQITEALSGADDLDAVHIVSHGIDGSIHLGNDTLNYGALLADTKLIQAWSSAFTASGDLLIYGCNLAASEDGRSLVDALSRLTGADVAASDDLTGNAERGGDWELEYQVGTLESSAAFSAKLQQNYQGILIGNISGVAFVDEGVTDIGAGKTISMLVNGVNVESVVTGAGGTYSFTSGVSAGDAVAMFIDNDVTYKGVTVTVSDGTDLSDVQILADHIVIRNDNGGVTSNADLANALGGSPDPDIHYAVVGGTLIANGVGDEVLIPTGHTYTPGGDVSASNIKILGTVNGGANTFSIAGDWNSTAGTWNADTSTVNLIGTGILLQNTSATPWVHGFNNLSVAAAGQTTTMSSVVWTSQLTTGTGVLTDAASSHALYLQGTGDVFIDGGGALDFDALHYRVNNATQNVVGRDYTGINELYFNAVGGLSGSGIYEMQGNVIANNVNIMINNDGNPGYVRNAVLNTNNFDFTATNLHVGVNGETDEYAVFNAGSSIVDINGDVIVYATDANGTNAINAATSSWTVSGDWVNQDTFTTGVSTIVLDGTGVLDSGGNVFHNLTTGAAGQVTTLASDLTVTGVLTIADPSGILTDNGAGYDITVTGAGTPFVNNGAAVTARNFIYSYPTDATITVAGGTYNVSESLWFAGDGTGSGTTHRLSDDLLVTGNLHIYAINFGVSILDTMNYSITADSMRVSNSSFQVGFLYANNSIVDINGDVDFVVSVTTSVSLGGSNWSVSGNWTNNSNTFNAGTSTINFDGITQTISGSTAFYNFTKIEATDDATDSTLIFDNTATQTVTGTLTLDGLDTDDRINLVSDSPASQWSINLSASATKGTLDYLDVADSDASGSDASHKLINPANSFNSGNNIDWFNNSAPTIGGTVGGQAVNDNATIQPFSSVVIGDNDVIETLTVTVTLDVAAKGVFSTLNGFTDTGGGVYTFSGTAAAATSAIQGLVFDPSDNRVAPGATETTTFSISVDDGIAAPATDATTTVVSTSINDAPVAVNDSYNVSEGGGGFLPPMGVLLNDSDIDSGSLTAIQLSNVTHGTLTLNPNGSFWYTRDPNYYGVDSFTYKVNDGSLDSNVATVTFNIAPRNDAPTGSDTTVTTLEDTDYVFSSTDFGFSDPVEGDGLLAVRIATLPGAGTLTLVGSGAVSSGDFVSKADLDANKLIFTPAADASGSAYTSFTFQVQDDGGTANGGMNLDSTPNTLTIDVTAVNDAPTTSGISNITVNEDTLVTFMNLQGSFADTEDAASALVYTITSNTNPSLFAAISLSSNGALNMNYATDQNGSTDITVRATDTGGSFVESTFTVTVNPVNDAPTVSGTSSDTGFEDTVRVYTHAELLALIGAADVDDADASLSVSISNVVNGAVSLSSGTGGVGTTFTFTPTLNYVGNLIFDYQVSDDEAATSVVGTATVALGAVNDAPIQSLPSAQSTAANSALIFSSLDGNSITVSDPDGAGTMLEVTLTASTGSISLADTGGLIFGVGSGSGDKTMTFSGTANMINAALDGMYYQSDPGYLGAASLTVITGDLGNTGSGGALSTRDVVEISVSNNALLSAIDEMIDEFVDFPLEDIVDPYVPPNTVSAASLAETSVDETPGTTGDAKTSQSETVSPEAVLVSIQDLRGNETGAINSLAALEVKTFDSSSSKPTASLLVQRAVQMALADPLMVAKTLMQLQPDTPIWNIIDTMMEQMDDDSSHERLGQNLTVTTTTGLTLTLTAGYVSWLLRAGYISASLLSIAPLWRAFDPLPILNTTAKITLDSIETEQSGAEPETDIEAMFASSGLPGPAQNGNGATP